ncbi:MAG TPA: DUF2142 domain-containing protein [Nocardia sp.]|uniref:DUF2142 domain-containing protein n=1 Tax=Nocardia sp. TaxID=1821 RepID=UPI002B4B86B5|nr:DUF2142 domain-containing protein [Nocardia sp.]HLS75365.1 DUF2142 domain-containing protein [Nocardia sp.]
MSGATESGVADKDSAEASARATEAAATVTDSRDAAAAPAEAAPAEAATAEAATAATAVRELPARNRTRAFAVRAHRRLGGATIAFVVLAGLFGAVFSVITPPFWGHDEITQFGRAYQVAHGGLLPTEIDDERGVAYGDVVPVEFDELMGYALDDYTNNPGEPDPMVADPMVYERLRAAEPGEETTAVWFTNTAAYSPVAYVPAAIGIRTAEALGLDVGDTVLLTRLSGLFGYLLVGGFALYTLRRHRVQWLALTVAVLPIAVFQAGTVTADTMTNALALLVSALLVKGLFLGRAYTKPETVAYLAATLLLPLSKPTYVLLAMLIVLVPVRRFAFFGGVAERGFDWRRLVPWAFACVGGVSFLAWMSIAAPTGDGMSLMRPPHQWYTVKPDEQLGEILGDPIGFLGVFRDSLIYRDQLWFTQFFGELGFAYIEVPALTVLACLLALAVSVGIGDRMDPVSADRLRTWLIALTVAASVAMIYVTLYMSFTPVGYYIIDGVQGRYFVPLALLGLVTLLRWMPLRLTDERGRTPVAGPAIVIVSATTLALVATVVKYHSIVWG